MPRLTIILSTIRSSVFKFPMTHLTFDCVFYGLKKVRIQIRSTTVISWCLLHILKSIVLSPLCPLQFIYWRKALSYRIAHFGSCWWYPWGYTLTHFSVFCISYELVLGYRVSTRLGIYLFIFGKAMLETVLCFSWHK